MGKTLITASNETLLGLNRAAAFIGAPSQLSISTGFNTGMGAEIITTTPAQEVASPK